MKIASFSTYAKGAAAHYSVHARQYSISTWTMIGLICVFIVSSCVVSQFATVGGKITTLPERMPRTTHVNTMAAPHVQHEDLSAPFRSGTMTPYSLHKGKPESRLRMQQDDTEKEQKLRGIWSVADLPTIPNISLEESHALAIQRGPREVRSALESLWTSLPKSTKSSTTSASSSSSPYTYPSSSSSSSPNTLASWLAAVPKPQVYWPTASQGSSDAGASTPRLWTVRTVADASALVQDLHARGIHVERLVTPHALPVLRVGGTENHYTIAATEDYSAQVSAVENVAMLFNACLFALSLSLSLCCPFHIPDTRSFTPHHHPSTHHHFLLHLILSLSLSFIPNSTPLFRS